MNLSCWWAGTDYCSVRFSETANGLNLYFPFSGEGKSISSPAALEFNFFFLTLWRGQYISKVRVQLKEIHPLYRISGSIW